MSLTGSKVQESMGTPSGESIHFAQKSTRHSPAHALFIIEATGVINAILGALMILVHALLQMLAPGAQAVRLYVVLSIPVVLGALLILLVVLRDRWFANAEHSEPDPEVRLNCIAPRELILRLGPIADLPFPPQVFRLTLGAPLSSRDVVLACVLGAAAVIVIILAGAAPFWVYMTLWLAMGTALGVVACLRPTYVRVVPGRLELLRYGLLPSRACQVRSYDLRKARVLVDLRRCVAFIDEQETQCDFSFALAVRADRLAYYVLRAATSTSTAPSLPTETFLG
ncbi:MAG: hypothetical protein JSU86_05055 [Phycisphaerales bacterium]|nr:MAG: hypothetical protein JSU86_05055 [Phycisphaerales bacterium]